MAELIGRPDPEVVRRNLTRIRERVGDDVEVLVATKYVATDDLGTLAEAGVTLVGENRLQDLEEKQARWGDAFTWDFIGNIQSRKAVEVASRVRLIHSLSTDSALRRLEPLGGEGEEAPEGDRAGRAVEALVQVNVAGEQAKGGVGPEGLDAFIDACPVPVTGLMTMPPLSSDPESSRPHFARLAELARTRGLERLSMGTSQDWEVAVEEGATIIRLGSILLE